MVQTFRVLGSAGLLVSTLINAENNEYMLTKLIQFQDHYHSTYGKTDRNFTELMTSLVELALKRQRERESLTFSFESNVLALQGAGTKGAKGTKA